MWKCDACGETFKEERSGNYHVTWHSPCDTMGADLIKLENVMSLKEVFNKSKSDYSKYVEESMKREKEKKEKELIKKNQRRDTFTKEIIKKILKSPQSNKCIVVYEYPDKLTNYELYMLDDANLIKDILSKEGIRYKIEETFHYQDNEYGTNYDKKYKYHQIVIYK